MTIDSPMGPAAVPPHLPQQQEKKEKTRLAVVARRCLAAALVACVSGLVVLAALLQCLRTESGTRWVLQYGPGLSVEEPRGALWGDFEARTVELSLGAHRIRIAQLAWQGLDWSLRPAPGVWLGVRMHHLHAAQVDLVLGPRSGAAPPPWAPPPHVQLPLAWEIKELKVGTLTWAAASPTQASPQSVQSVHNVHTRVEVGGKNGQVHALRDLSLEWGPMKIAGNVEVHTVAPMRTAATLAVQPIQGLQAQPAPSPSPHFLRDWEGQLEVSGALAELDVQATARRLPAASAAGYLHAQATLQPWAPWPVVALQGEARDIDLQSFDARAPHTALRAQLASLASSATQPAGVSLTVHNDAAGQWPQQRLPVRQFSVQLRARNQLHLGVDIHALQVALGTDRLDGGRVEGRGHVSPGPWKLALQGHDIQPAYLDARAAPVRLSGPILFEGDSAGLQARLSLQGRSDRPDLPLKLELKGGIQKAAAATPAAPAHPERWTLETLQAQWGRATWGLSGVGQRDLGAGEWALQARTKLHQFDPLQWWPGPEGSVWRQGGHRLNGEASVDLRTLPQTPKGAAGSGPSHPSLHWLALWRGEVALQLTDSQLAGVPWSAQGSLQRAQGPAHLRLQVQAAKNKLLIDADWPLSADKPAQVELNAPELQALSAWGSLFRSHKAVLPLGGQLQGRAEVTGLGDQLHTQGQLSGANIRWGDHHVQGLQSQWRVSTVPNSPVQMHVQIQEARGFGMSIPSLDAQASGRLDEHTLRLQALLDAQPPAWMDALRNLGAQQPPAAVAAVPGKPLIQWEFAAQGGLTAATANPGAGLPTGWQGQILRWSVHSQPALSLPPWWRGQAVSVAAQWGGGAPSLRMSASQAQWGSSTVRWGPLYWQATPSGPSRLDAELSIDPFMVAPLLAHLQPDFGWSGDLRVGLQAKIHTHPQMHTEVVLERYSGDLSIVEGANTRALSVNTLRLGLSGTPGQWTFTQAVAGQNLGVLSGALIARTGPDTLWPKPQTPLQGVLELQVAELGGWGTWLPAGWRLGGQLRASAGLAGSWSAPQLTGAVQGSGLSARNVLQGINLTQGTVDITLKGDKAQINHLSAQSGEGTLVLQGQAQLGPTPWAQLDMKLDRFQLLGRVDRRLVASGQAQLGLRPQSIDLSGKWKIDEGLIDFSRGGAPTLADDVRVVRERLPENVLQASVAPSRPVPPPAAAIPVKLDLEVNLGSALELKGRGLDTILRGALQVSSSMGKLEVQGTVDAAGGSYKAYGQQLTINRGSVIFSGDVNNPRLDIEATRPDTGEVRVGVLITGNAQTPRVRLFSDPDMADVEKLSWLVLGRASDGLGGTDIALLQRAAVALLSGEGEGVSDQLMRVIGLDQLSVRQSDGAVKETIVSLGRQLSDRWSVGYERSLNATEGSWQLIYRIAQRLTLRAQTGHENAADLIWSWRWD